MKKFITIIILTFLFLNVFDIFTSIETCKASGNVLYVDDDGADYTNIQDAIDVASDGDIVYIYSGIYYESITINISITLEGENKETTFIKSDNKGHAINVKNTDDVIIKKLSITAGWKDFGDGSGSPFSGIRFTSVTESIIDDCNIFNCSSNGIYISYSDSYNNVISNSICSNNNQDGIRLSGSFNNTIENNNCSNNKGSGIYISSNNNRVINNTFFSNDKRGVFIFGSECQNNILYHNKFKNNRYENAVNKGLNKWYSIELHEGNYWDDYEHMDENGDGIGDIPYIIDIDDNIKDEYPLGYFREEKYEQPNATFYYSPKEPVVNQTVTFFLPDDFDEYDEINYFRWNFGDGTTYTKHNKSNRNHIYKNPGKYNVTLVITGFTRFEYTDTYSTTITISSSESEKDNNIPGYEILISLCAVILSLLFKRKNRM